MYASPTPPGRPRVVEIGFWVLSLGAVLLIGGGLLVATMSFDLIRSVVPEDVTDDEIRRYLVLRRGVGVLYAVAGIGLAYLSGRARRDADDRFRRAAVALGIAAALVLVPMTIFVGTGLVPLLAIIPIIAGVVAFTRPAASAWFHGLDPGADT